MTPHDNGALIPDLFAGPGGWSEGLRMLGLADVGIEWDDAACRTRKAAGHLTIRADVAEYPVEPFVGKTWGLIASPPCQDFSLAGKRAGIAGDRGQLVWQVLRWADALRPQWIACEQVPPVLEIWQHMAHVMRGWGYRTWTGILNAADYGVPQTRKRAFLLASANTPVQPPEPTHAREPSGDLFGGEREPWVSMAQALGWGMSERPCVTITAGGSRQGGPDPLDGGSGARAAVRRELHRGAWVLRRPATTVTGDPRLSPPNHHGPGEQVGQAVSTDSVRAWWEDRPATTVVGSFSPETIAAPGYRTTTSRQNAEGSVKVTLAEASVLQSFPPDYPWHGGKSKQFEQVGNAVPPLLAAHVLSALTGITLREDVAA